MKESISRVKEVVKDIEGKKMESLGSALSTDEVIVRLLGHDVEENEDRNIFKYNDSLGNAKEKLALLNKPFVWNIPFNRSVARGGITGKIKSVLIKIIRKLIRPVMSDIVAEQTRFNSFSVQFMNEIYAVSLKQERAVHKMVRDLYATDSGPNADNLKNVIDYERFQDHFRGSELDVKEQLKEYLQYLKNAKKLLDIGCGRGEFLELMAENGVDATGVEINGSYAGRCIQKGLNVSADDGINFLENSDDEVYDAITSFEVIDYMPIERVVELCQMANRKLKPGGVMILETRNPASLSAYMEPSVNMRMIHPDILSYFAGEAGFSNKEIHVTNDGKNYALIATK